jgi:hypothetical protein
MNQARGKTSYSLVVALTFLVLLIIGLIILMMNGPSASSSHSTSRVNDQLPNDSSNQLHERMVADVEKLQSAGVVTDINKASHTIRFDDDEWYKCDVDQKQKIVRAMAIYMSDDDTASFVKVLSNRNDDVLGECGLLGGITVYK